MGLIPSEITNYFYSTGLIGDVTQGRLEKTLVTNNQINYKDLIEDSKRKIIMPKIIGIYQEEHYAGDSQEKVEKRSRLRRESFEFRKKHFLDFYSVEEKNEPTLIHIGYNPSLMPYEAVMAGLEDPLMRIKISSLDEIPDFFKKDKTLLTQLELFQESDISEAFKPGGSKKMQKKALQLEPEMRRIEKELKPYGLTNEEWQIIHGTYLLADPMGTRRLSY